LTSFLNKAARQDQQMVLILEDYHVITEPSIHQTLNFFLAHLPQALHLVVIARHEPPLPPSRLRANGDLNEIRAADLHFSHEEMLTRLDSNLEGWAAGLRLLSLSLQGNLSRAQVEHILTTSLAASGPCKTIL
jgi:LuxR family maltose regulon positive regulatory protein